MTSALAEFQDGLARALFAADVQAVSLPAAARRAASQAGFSVYRNTVMRGYVDALEANFPAIVRLVGKEWFRAAAATYARLHPPENPILALYGDRFPNFLESFEPARGLPYLADVASLDRLWVEAATASDAPKLDASRLAGTAPVHLAEICVAIHPATRFAWFDTNASTIWFDARALEPERQELTFEERGEGVLITRLEESIVAHRLSPGGFRFITQLASGGPLGDSATAALACEPEFALADLLLSLLEGGAFSELTPPQHRRPQR